MILLWTNQQALWYDLDPKQPGDLSAFQMCFALQEHLAYSAIPVEMPMHRSVS